MMPLQRISHMNNFNFTRKCLTKVESSDFLKKRMLFGAFCGALFMLNAASDDCKNKTKIFKVDIPCIGLYGTIGALLGGVIVRTARVSIPLILIFCLSSSQPAPRPRKS